MQSELVRTLVAVAAVGLLFWDIAVALLLGPEATVWRVLLTWSREHPVLPFAVGAAIGHIFSRSYGGKA